MCDGRKQSGVDASDHSAHEIAGFFGRDRQTARHLRSEPLTIRPVREESRGNDVEEVV
jgi:hypothetical protein